VGGWGFDESTGNVAFDESGLGNDASITGALFTASGRFGGARSYDGNGDWVTVEDAGSLDVTSAMTLEAWVYPTGSLAVARPVVGKERPSNAAWFLNAATAGSANPSVAVRAGNSNVVVTAGGPLPVNTWTHLAATYDGASLRLYVNGALAAERATSGVLATSSRPLRIGHNDVAGGVFLGRIDEVRVYARALTAPEIQADMTRAVP
jgi:Concanavalin A-like lectin/glucanases superfamily